MIPNLNMSRTYDNFFSLRWYYSSFVFPFDACNSIKQFLIINEHKSSQEKFFLDGIILTGCYILSLPFITHIYGGTITGLLYENLYLATSVLLFFSLLSFKSISFKYLLYFSPMLLAVIYNLFFPFGEYTVINCLKYLAYFAIFFLYLDAYLTKNL